jgi:hypothetical protein
MANSQLAQCLEPDDVALLVQCFGAGQLLYVPSSTANARHLEVILGLTATTALINALGGNNVYLPGLKRSDGRPRAPSLALVKALSQPGPRRLSAAAIARRFHVSLRTIMHKRKEIARRERLGLPLDNDQLFRIIAKDRARGANGQWKTSRAKNARESRQQAGEPRRSAERRLGNG